MGEELNLVILVWNNKSVFYKQIVKLEDQQICDSDHKGSTLEYVVGLTNLLFCYVASYAYVHNIQCTLNVHTQYGVLFVSNYM